MRRIGEAMVDVGTAIIAHQNGKVRSVKLITTASTHLVRIGEPTGGWGGVKFTRKAKLDIPAVVWEHHPRSTYE